MRTPLAVKVLQVAVVLVVLVPIVWMVGVALKPGDEPFASPAQLWPDSPTLDNFASALRPQFGAYFLNSTIVAAASVVVSVGLGLLGAYGMVQSGRRIRVILITALVTGQMVPAATIIIPIFGAARQLNVIDTHIALIVSYIALTLPVATVMNYAFMKTIPFELFEAARIDGASGARTFRSVILPLSVPGIISSSVWLLIVVWQEFLFALALTTSPEMRTLPVGLSDFIGQYGIRYGELMATGIAMSVPIVVLFFFLQRYFVSGLTAGATKG